MKKQLLSFVLVAGWLAGVAQAQTTTGTASDTAVPVLPKATVNLQQTAQQQPSASAATLPQTQQYLLHSKLTGRTYRIQTMAVGSQPTEGYMPVYVLDGDMMFPTAATAAYTFYHHAKDNGAQPLLIVGIGYDNGKLLDIPMRSLDYTPPMAAKGKISDSQPKRGEADAFLRMLRSELKPQLQQQYRLQADKAAIIGHSYGGVLALYALLQHPQDFSHYIISSPSMWWNEGALQHLPASYFKPLLQAKQDKFVRITVGEYEQAASPYVDANGERAKILADKQMVDKVDAMAKRLQALPNQHLRVESEHYPAETHTGAMFRAVLDGIKYTYRAH
ncbi:alpha/beta fold hydrolase [Vitreoscilla massiliensis]|uniref:Alpha/beta fold hydrolase n=1 Tax=Vitreoscilla massiliensis TaxID=1689272 RepID=A0ABY4E1Z7_9NEIS|nr:alpha/beta fold hydrolase [Vitreoscilla massiliensis]UOO89390.1 alpha/beta fold hydrolase [Vitreoscilla massiliensis]